MRTTLLVLLLSVAIISPVSAADSPKRPNILFALADDASFPYMSAYGCKWVNTPAFDRVAHEGILFTRAYTPNAKCAPSRSCILTGRNSWQLEAAANHYPFFPDKFKVYTEALAEHGYTVGSTAKGWGPGVAVDKDGKPRQLAGKPVNNRKLTPPTTGISPIDYAANFELFLNQADKNQPWCFWFGSLEPHRPYEYGSGVAKGHKKLSDIDEVPKMWPDNETTRNDLLDYAYEVEHFDQHLGRMIETLQKRGMLENTLIIVTADNGMPFPRLKGHACDQSNQLPLAIMWKAGIAAPGRIVEDYVSFIDFAPTFLDVAGIDAAQSGMQPMTGRSLSENFRSTRAGRVIPQRDHVLIGQERHDVGRPHDWGYPIRGIVWGNLLFIRNYEPSRWPAGNPETGYPNTDGSPTKSLILSERDSPVGRRFYDLSFGLRQPEELYDLTTDPYCLHNLAHDPNWRARRIELETAMTAELKQQADPRMFGRGDEFDK
jgi:arylsulfatase A-like enzyme